MNIDQLKNINSLSELLVQRASENKGRWIFLENRGRRENVVDYVHLDQRARSVAASMKEGGIAAGDRVLLLFQSGSGFLEAFFGCMYLGVVAVPLNPPRPNRKRGRFLSVMKDCSASIILTDSVTSKTLDQYSDEISFQIVEHIETEPSALEEPHMPDREELAFLQYTSGSTGSPKGVKVSHLNIMANLEVIRDSGVTDDDVFVNWLPFFHDMGLIHTLLEPLYAGLLSVHIPPAEFMQRPFSWLKAIEAYGGTVCGGPNFAFELLCQKATPEILATLDLTRWTKTFTGAEPIRAATLQRFAETFASTGYRYPSFYPCYGLAEATLMVTGGVATEAPRTLRLDREALSKNYVVQAEENANASVIVDSGAPRPSVDVAIVDPQTKMKLDSGHIGEVWVAGDIVASGYWKNPEATRAVFHNRLSEDGPNYLATGDLGFMEDGHVYITGRLKDLIIIRGRNYFPADVEVSVSNACPDFHLDGCAAFSVEEDGETRLIVAQEIQRGSRRTFDAEQAGEAARLAVSHNHDLQLHRMVFLKYGGMPKTSSGKVQRSACRAAYLDGSLSMLGQWPELSSETKPEPTVVTDIQTRLTELVAGRLGISPGKIDPDEPFALYGMDSKVALGILGDLEQELNRELSPALIYEHPTIADLAAFLSGKSEKQVVHIGDRAEPIAVVGMACRFPGAPDLESFWDLLREGKDAITEVPASRWDADEYYDPEPGTPDKMTTRWGGFLTDVDQFDAGLFGISATEAENMDPQQRLLLELSWEAMEHTGFDVSHFKGSNTGVFVGVAGSDYSFFQRLRDGGRNAFAGIGAASSIAANRISWQFDLRGPSFAVDTACSSALVAIDRACRSIQQGECEAALTAAVNLILSPELTTTLSQAGMMSPDGRCFAFDERAGGYVRSEGCAALMLKPLSAARRDGNHVLGVIAGSAVNQDGRGNGLTAPNGRAQKEVILKALGRAGLKGHQIQYLEAHGTGTALGDPIEMEALKAVLTPGRAPDSACLVGSVKTNIGHTETVAGMAGLIKVLLALREQSIPGQLHLQKLNPHIHLENTPLKIATEAASWKQAAQPRLAGVSSFGIGGTNAHIIVAEAPKDIAEPVSENRPRMLALSAASPESLDLAEEKLHQVLAQTTQLEPIANTLQLGRRQFPYRCAWVAERSKQNPRIYRGIAPAKAPEVAFLFPGQGSQFAGMGVSLYQAEPVYAKALDQCLEILRGEDLDLREFLTKPNHTDELRETRLAQPALFSVSYATALFWESRGLRPNFMIGHSIGEFVAACLAGVFSLENALRLVKRRGELMQSVNPGSMLAVSCSEAELSEVMTPELAFAAFNGPNRLVVSGSSSDIDALQDRLESRGIVSKCLITSHAFHSHMMTPILGAFREAVEQAAPQKPTIPFISNVSGTWITDKQAICPDYWADQLRLPVQFDMGLLTLAEKTKLMIESGPGSTLTKLARAILGPDHKDGLIQSLAGPKDAHNDLFLAEQAQARLWVQGAPLKWDQKTDSNQRAPLPPLQMTRKSYWVDRGAISTPTLAREKNMADWFYAPVWRQSPSAPPRKHQAGTTLIFHDGSEMAKGLQQRLEIQGERVVLAKIGDGFRIVPDGIYLNPQFNEGYEALAQHLKEKDLLPNRIIHCWLHENAVIQEEDGAASCLKQGFYSLISLMQAWEPHGLDFRLLVVTRDVYAVSPGDVVHAEKATILGPVTVIEREYPEVTSCHLDLAHDMNVDQAADHMVAVLNTPTPQTTQAARNQHRWTREFQAVPIESSETPALVKQGGVYLITGGLGAVGRALGDWLSRFEAKLVLMGRSPLPDRATWGALSDDIGQETRDRIRAVQNMESRGAEVMLVSGDVTDYTSLYRIVNDVERRFGSINGVIHAAGVPGDGMIRFKQEQAAQAVLAPKVEGALNLEELFKDKNPDFIVWCSSVFALSGEFGQVDYCAANAFLDHLAEARDQPQNRRISISWGTWREGGMAASMNLAPALKEAYQRQLRMGFSAQEGGEALGRALFYGQPRVAVNTQNLEALLNAWKQIESKLTQPDRPAEVVERARTSETIFEEPVGDDEIGIAKIWTALTGVSPIGRHDSFFELGGDSLVATQMFAQLQKELGHAPSIAQFYEQPTIAGVVAILEQHKPEQANQLNATAEEDAALSFAQHRLWFDCQRQGSSAPYNLPGRIEIRGDLDRQALLQALQSVVDRHESLRMRFDEKDGAPFTVVEPKLEASLDFADLSEMEPESMEIKLNEISHQVSNFEFDLNQAPLFYMKLVRLKHRHVLLINMHHIIFDGWSEGVLMRDWIHFYTSPQEALPPLMLRNADLVVWERKRLADKQQEQWWSQQMADAPVLDLPRDRKGERHAGSYEIVLEPTLFETFSQFAIKEKTTRFAATMAAYLLTLYRYTGQRDLVIGTDFANRQQPGSEAMIGFFVNPLPLRVQIDKEESLRDFTSQVRKQLNSCADYQSMPMHRLVELTRSAQDKPLIQSIFVQQNADFQGLEGGGLTWSLHREPPPCKFENAIFVTENKTGMRIILTWASDLFLEETMQDLGKHMVNSLEQIVYHSDTKVGELQTIKKRQPKLKSLPKHLKKSARKPVHT